MCQIFFEKFKVPKFYIGSSASFSLFLSGKTTGIVLESGDGSTTVVPVFAGSTVSHAVQTSELNGMFMTKYLSQLLARNGNSGAISQSKQIKEKLCYVSADFNDEMKSYTTNRLKWKNYMMPDKSLIEIGPEQIECP